MDVYSEGKLMVFEFLRIPLNWVEFGLTEWSSRGALSLDQRPRSAIPTDSGRPQMVILRHTLIPGPSPIRGEPSPGLSQRERGWEKSDQQAELSLRGLAAGAARAALAKDRGQ